MVKGDKGGGRAQGLKGIRVGARRNPNCSAHAKTITATAADRIGGREGEGEEGWDGISISISETYAVTALENGSYLLCFI